MPYILRNTIVLAILLILIWAIGLYFRFGALPKKIEKIEKDIKAIETELQNTPDLLNQYNILSEQIASAKNRWETREKEIPPVNTSGQTYDYLNKVLETSGEVKMDILFVESHNKPNYGYNVYNIKGEAPFENLFRFFWYIENNKPLYKIKSLNLRGVETKKKITGEIEILVTYELILEAYFTHITDLNISASTSKPIPISLTYDPFYPLILTDVPQNIDDLVEIERSDLKAVIQGKAFLTDQNDKMRTLSEGDEVYLGYVTKIDATTGRLECTLNKGGIIEKFELHIRYGQKQK